MSSNDHKSGRRVHERVRLPLQVAYRSTGSFLISYTVDLSRGGLFLETRDLQPEGTLLDLRLQIPGVDNDVVVRGRVVWLQIDAAPGRPTGMGVQFEEVEDRFGSFIDGLVRQFSGLRILLSSPSGRPRAQLGRILRGSVTATVLEHDPQEGDAWQAEETYDLAVIDLPDGHRPSLSLLEHLIRQQPHVAVVAITANPRLRRQALDLGACEVIDSPTSGSELRVAVLRALARPVILAVPSQEES